MAGGSARAERRKGCLAGALRSSPLPVCLLLWLLVHCRVLQHRGSGTAIRKRGYLLFLAEFPVWVYWGRRESGEYIAGGIDGSGEVPGRPAPPLTKRDWARVHASAAAYRNCGRVTRHCGDNSPGICYRTRSAVGYCREGGAVQAVPAQQGKPKYYWARARGSSASSARVGSGGHIP